MYSSGFGNASGYESTPVDRLALNPGGNVHKRPQISDAQLKTLPVFGYEDTMYSFSDPFLGVPNLTPRDLGFRAESDQKCSGGCQSAQNLIIEHCYVCGHPTGIPILISGTF